MRPTPGPGAETLPGPGAGQDQELAAATRGLGKRFKGVDAVSELDLEVPRGSVLGLLGPNGSGKTTTIRMLLGLTAPSTGTVELLGARMPDQAQHVLSTVGALVEGPGFHSFLSGRDNLRRCAAAEPRLATRSIKAAVDSALERVGLTEAADRRYRGYSLGMKQRLGLAAALLVPRELVILDEPTNGLDPAGTREVRAVIGELHREGTTVIVSSHLLAEVEATCTHVAVMNRGSLVAQGQLDELLEAGNTGLEVRTEEAPAALEALGAERIAAREVEGGVLVDLTTARPEQVLRVLVRAEVAVTEARKQRTGLEDLFAQLTEEGAQA
ncbi:ABC transporter ATP-binding protein [Sciscionella sediminilitoris]|uniref:ABC transporter ATP-binding protein n=1 Tax=Sciscionella sediminilitoris TaxID=1445613 RepID=UPI001E457085|nr:ABC transporter ATP-binding protein [Sciscionella sp. SE31]